MRTSPEIREELLSNIALDDVTQDCLIRIRRDAQALKNYGCLSYEDYETVGTKIRRELKKQEAVADLNK
jgi:hypothetical protein